MIKKETRLAEVELREEDEKMILEGYAILYNEETLIGTREYGFIESIDPNALSEDAIKDVPMKYNHMDSFLIIARTKNKSLELTSDERGLKVRAELLDTQHNKDIYKMVKSGLLEKMSFAFTVKEQEWLIAVVSLVYIIARGVGKYLGTNLGARVAKSDDNIRKYLGLALLPQGGISIGLLVIISTQMTSMYPVISTIIMLSVLVYETSGPIFAKIAISRSGEVDGLDKLEELSSIADLAMEGE